MPMPAPLVLARLRNVPTRAFAALFVFGGILGLPAIIGCAAALFFSLELALAGVLLVLLASVVCLGTIIGAWVLIFQASARLQRAERALYAGDFERATREALFVTRTVFRSDYQTGALFTLALAAERVGAFAEAGALFGRALGMIPALAAQRPRRRATALITAHAALDYAAANDPKNAHAMLARCFAVLGAPDQPGAFDGILDDSHMGAIGINTVLMSLENRREPRALAALAGVLVAFKDGRLEEAAQTLAQERDGIQHGLAPHERALAERVQKEALRLRTGAGPHRSPGELAPVQVGLEVPDGWASLIVP